jgi:hypothetical protein
MALIGHKRTFVQRKPNMSIPESIAGLSDLFKRLGASNPDQWAKSQVEVNRPGFRGGRLV